MEIAADITASNTNMAFAFVEHSVWQEGKLYKTCKSHYNKNYDQSFESL